MDERDDSYFLFLYFYFLQGLEVQLVGIFPWFRLEGSWRVVEH